MLIRQSKELFQAPLFFVKMSVFMVLKIAVIYKYSKNENLVIFDINAY